MLDEDQLAKSGQLVASDLMLTLYSPYKHVRNLFSILGGGGVLLVQINSFLLITISKISKKQNQLQIIFSTVNQIIVYMYAVVQKNLFRTLNYQTKELQISF